MEPEPRPAGAGKLESAGKLEGAGKREKVIWLAGVTGVTVVAVFVLPSIASYAQIAKTITSLSASQVFILLAMSFGVIAVAGWSAKVAMSGLTWWRASLSAVCANFMTALVPTGADLAVRFAMYRSWGFQTSRVTTAIAVTGVGRYITLLSLPVTGMAVLVLTGRGQPDTPLLLALGLLAFVLLTGVPWLLLRREDLAHRFAYRLGHAVRGWARLFKRPAPQHIEERVLSLRAQIVSEFKQRGGIVTFGQLVAAFTNSVVLFAAMRFVGLGPDVISWAQTFYAFALGTISNLVPLTPGNVGVTELIILGVLALDGGNYQPQILAAALLYRVFTWMVPIPLGAITFFWWRYQQSHSAAANAADENVISP